MGRMLRMALGLVVVAGVSIAAAGEEKFGKGVTLTEATPIKALYENPDKFVGKTVRIDGIVTGVCDEMGCWMALGDSEKAEQTIRFKVDHDTKIAFPISAKGKAASAEGVFEKIAASDKESKNAADEHAAHAAHAGGQQHGEHKAPATHHATPAQQKAAEFNKTYQIKATGAVVK